jgi:hypothetical protein
MGTMVLSPFDKPQRHIPLATGHHFFSLPGHGNRDVPAKQLQGGEFPFAPQQAVGMSVNAFTGPDILLFALGPPVRLRSVKVSARAQGSVSIAVVSPYTATPRFAVGGWGPQIGGDTWYVIPRSPLTGNTTYTVTAQWAAAQGSYTHTQTITFTTTCTLLAPPAIPSGGQKITGCPHTTWVSPPFSS